MNLPQPQNKMKSFTFLLFVIQILFIKIYGQACSFERGTCTDDALYKFDSDKSLISQRFGSVYYRDPFAISLIIHKTQKTDFVNVTLDVRGSKLNLIYGKVPVDAYRLLIMSEKGATTAPSRTTSIVRDIFKEIMQKVTKITLDPDGKKVRFETGSQQRIVFLLDEHTDTLFLRGLSSVDAEGASTEFDAKKELVKTNVFKIQEVSYQIETTTTLLNFTKDLRVVFTEIDEQHVKFHIGAPKTSSWLSFEYIFGENFSIVDRQYGELLEKFYENQYLIVVEILESAEQMQFFDFEGEITISITSAGTAIKLIVDRERSGDTGTLTLGIIKYDPCYTALRVKGSFETVYYIFHDDRRIWKTVYYVKKGTSRKLGERLLTQEERELYEYIEKAQSIRTQEQPDGDVNILLRLPSTEVKFKIEHLEDLSRRYNLAYVSYYYDPSLSTVELRDYTIEAPVYLDVSFVTKDFKRLILRKDGKYFYSVMYDEATGDINKIHLAHTEVSTTYFGYTPEQYLSYYLLHATSIHFEDQGVKFICKPYEEKAQTLYFVGQVMPSDLSRKRLAYEEEYMEDAGYTFRMAYSRTNGVLTKVDAFMSSRDCDVKLSMDVENKASKELIPTYADTRYKTSAKYMGIDMRILKSILTTAISAEVKNDTAIMIKDKSGYDLKCVLDQKSSYYKRFKPGTECAFELVPETFRYEGKFLAQQGEYIPEKLDIVVQILTTRSFFIQTTLAYRKRYLVRFRERGGWVYSVFKSEEMKVKNDTDQVYAFEEKLETVMLGIIRVILDEENSLEFVQSTGTFFASRLTRGNCYESPRPVLSYNITNSGTIRPTVIPSKDECWIEVYFPYQGRIVFYCYSENEELKTRFDVSYLSSKKIKNFSVERATALYDKLEEIIKSSEKVIIEKKRFVFQSSSSELILEGLPDFQRSFVHKHKITYTIQTLKPSNKPGDIEYECKSAVYVDMAPAYLYDCSKPAEGFYMLDPVEHLYSKDGNMTIPQSVPGYSLLEIKLSTDERLSLIVYGYMETYKIEIRFSGTGKSKRVSGYNVEDLPHTSQHLVSQIESIKETQQVLDSLVKLHIKGVKLVRATPGSVVFVLGDGRSCTFISHSLAKYDVVTESYRKSGVAESLYGDQQKYSIELTTAEFYHHQTRIFVIHGRKTYTFSMELKRVDGWILGKKFIGEVIISEAPPGSANDFYSPEEKIVEIMKKAEQISVETNGRIQIIADSGKTRIAFDLAAVRVAAYDVQGKVRGIFKVSERTYHVKGEFVTLPSSVKQATIIIEQIYRGGLRLIYRGTTSGFTVIHLYQDEDGWIRKSHLKTRPYPEWWLSSTAHEKGTEEALMVLLATPQQIIFNQDGSFQFVKDFGSTRITVA